MSVHWSIGYCSAARNACCSTKRKSESNLWETPRPSDKIYLRYHRSARQAGIAPVIQGSTAMHQIHPEEGNASSPSIALVVSICILRLRCYIQEGALDGTCSATLFLKRDVPHSTYTVVSSVIPLSRPSGTDRIPAPPTNSLYRGEQQGVDKYGNEYILKPTMSVMQTNRRVRTGRRPAQ